MQTYKHEKMKAFFLGLIVFISCLAVTAIEALFIVFIISNMYDQTYWFIGIIIGFLLKCFILYKASKNGCYPFTLCMLTLIIVTVFILGWQMYYRDHAGGRTGQYNKLFLSCVTEGKLTELEDTGGKKLICCEINQYGTNWTREFIPNGYAAKGTKDVGGILIVDEKDMPVGSYTNGGTAYIYNFSVRIIDPYTGKEIAFTSFRGSSPPSSTSSYGAHGKKPSTKKIKKWVKENWSYKP